MGWKQIGGNLGRLVVGKVNNIWGVNSAKKDAVVNKDHIWGVNHIGKIFYRTGSNINNGRWVEVPDGLSNVSVASDGTIWGVQIPGKFKQVYTSSEKLVVGVNYNDRIFQYVNKGWQQFDSMLKNVAISIDGIV
nr:5774_t:CDS:2 [Entrophospora candida]